MSVPDRDLLREALADAVVYGSDQWEYDIDSILAAARAWLEQGNAIIIQRDDYQRLPLRRSALFGWILVFGKGDRPPEDVYVVVPGSVLSVEGDQ